jgi:hypothetical protein
METPSMTPEVMPAPDQPAPKKSNTGLIIGIVVVLLLCCCCILGIGGWYLWNNGDQFMKSSGALLSHII